MPAAKKAQPQQQKKGVGHHTPCQARYSMGQRERNKARNIARHNREMARRHANAERRRSIFVTDFSRPVQTEILQESDTEHLA